MSHHERMSVSGDVTEIFAHRFVVKTAKGAVLADLGPKGAETVALKRGDRVDLVGEMKPSELKVSSVARNGGPAVSIAHGKDHKPHHDDADPELALRAARAEGLAVLGSPRRKPKHFEVLGRDKAHRLMELHVELDGTIRHACATDASNPKWAAELHGS